MGVQGFQNVRHSRSHRGFANWLSPRYRHFAFCIQFLLARVLSFMDVGFDFCLHGCELVFVRMENVSNSVVGDK